MYSKILVPIDTTYAGDEWAKSSLVTAWEIARNSGAGLHVISVIPENLLKGYYPDLYTEDVAKHTRKRLEAVVKKCLPSDARVELTVAEGGICHEILRVARELPADLIVMASHGPLTKDYLLGSNASHVALHAPCSVFVVRKTSEAAE